MVLNNNQGQGDKHSERAKRVIAERIKRDSERYAEIESETLKTKLKGEIKSQIAEPPSQAEQVSQARATEQSE